MIADAALLERLRLSDEAFLAWYLDMARHFPAREWTPAAFAHGTRYPWRRPARSYLLRDGEAEPVDAEAIARHTCGDRVPLLAFGSNVAPRNLSLKFAHHDDAADREVLVLAGALHELDVVAAAAVALYGAMPATLAASPGTRVRVAVLLVNARQLETLVWGEMPYRLGWLDGAPFVSDEEVELDAPLAFVSRWGAFLPDGKPAPLAAIEAGGRRWRAWEQRELLDRAAVIALGDGADAEALTRRCFADFAGGADAVLTGLRDHAQPFDFPGWRPLAS